MKNIHIQIGLKQNKDLKVLVDMANIPVKIKISKLAGLLNYTISGNLHLNSSETEFVITSTLLLKGDNGFSDWLSKFTSIEEPLTQNILAPLSDKGKDVLTLLKCRIDDAPDFFSLVKSY